MISDLQEQVKTLVDGSLKEVTSVLDDVLGAESERSES